MRKRWLGIRFCSHPSSSYHSRVVGKLSRWWDNDRRVELAFENLVVRKSSFRYAGRAVFDGEDDIAEGVLELLLSKEQVSPHGRNLSHRVAKTRSYTKCPHAQIWMTMPGRNSQYHPHFLLHQLFFLGKGVTCPRVVQFWSSNRCDWYYWYRLERFPNLITFLGSWSKYNCSAIRLVAQNFDRHGIFTNRHGVNKCLQSVELDNGKAGANPRVS